MPPSAPPLELGGGIAAAGGQAWEVRAYTTVPTISHWDGTAWTTTTPLPPGFAGGDLQGITALGTTDVWAVGAAQSASGSYAPLAMHWDGTAWTSQFPPYDPATNGFLSAVSALASDDVWAVGYDSGTHAVDTPIVDHWNGTNWTQVGELPIGGTLSGVSALSSNDVWAIDVGGHVYHWNGRNWADIPFPGSASYPLLEGVSASSPTDAWVVGYSNADHGSLSMHWDGATWTQVAAPQLGAVPDGLSAVEDVSPRQAWAVGRWGHSDGLPLVLRWNGSVWRAVRSASPRDKGQRLVAVAREAGSHAIWALGNLGLVERYC